MSELDHTQYREDDHTERYDLASATRLAIRRLVLLVAPVGAATAMWIHPHAHGDVYDSLRPVVDSWLLAHALLFPSLGLVGVGLYLLVADHRGWTASLARVGLGIYGFCYLGFVAIVGLTSGLLVREAQGLPPAQQAGVAEVVTFLHADPVLFAMGAVGAVGYLLAVSTIAVVLYRAGAHPVPLAFLAGSTVTLVAHSGLVAIAGMALFGIAAAWLEFTRPWPAAGAVDSN